MDKLSPEAIAAGWRTIPENSIRWGWKYKHGCAWQVATYHEADREFIMGTSRFVAGSDDNAAKIYRQYYWRPVSLRTMQYDPEGWKDIQCTDPS